MQPVYWLINSMMSSRDQYMEHFSSCKFLLPFEKSFRFSEVFCLTIIKSHLFIKKNQYKYCSATKVFQVINGFMCVCVWMRACVCVCVCVSSRWSRFQSRPVTSTPPAPSAWARRTPTVAGASCSTCKSPFNPHDASVGAGGCRV